MSQPSDPFTAMAAGMAQMHEAYQSMVEAGFTPQQSMELVKELMRNGMAQNTKCPHCGKTPQDP